MRLVIKQRWRGFAIGLCSFVVAMCAAPPYALGLKSLGLWIFVIGSIGAFLGMPVHYGTMIHEQSEKLLKKDNSKKDRP